MIFSLYLSQTLMNAQGVQIAVTRIDLLASILKDPTDVFVNKVTNLVVLEAKFVSVSRIIFL